MLRCLCNKDSHQTGKEADNYERSTEHPHHRRPRRCPEGRHLRRHQRAHLHDLQLPHPHRRHSGGLERHPQQHLRPEPQCEPDGPPGQAVRPDRAESMNR